MDRVCQSHAVLREIVSLEWPSDGVALITVADDDTKNREITLGTIGKLADTLSAARRSGARVSVIASGIRGEWLHDAHTGQLTDMTTGKETGFGISGWVRAFNELAHPDVVSIAAISGDTSGSGCELGWACDFRIAEEGVQFKQPTSQIGVCAGIGDTSRLRRLIGRSAIAELILAGRPMVAERLYQLGAINSLVSKDRSVVEALTLARHLSEVRRAELRGMKRMLIGE